MISKISLYDPTTTSGGRPKLARVWVQLIDIDRTYFCGKEHRQISLVSQGKSNHNICDVRLDYGVEVLEDAYLKELVRYIHINPLRAR